MSFLHVFRRAPSCFVRVTRSYAIDSPAASKAPPSSGKKAASPTAAAPRSSCVPDTLIVGANYLKAQPPVLARPDEEYPEWLWTILQPKVWPDDGPGGKAERVKRRNENRQRIKDRNFMSTQ